MGRLLDSAIYAIGLAVLVYVACCVPLGQRTLLEHLIRIGQTEPAQELREGAMDTARQAREELETNVEQQTREVLNRVREAGVGVHGN